ncbi:MAG: RNA polymerase sigma factor [Sandaracinaceae bacterium]
MSEEIRLLPTSRETARDASAPSDGELLARCAAGDERAMRLLYEREVDAVHRKLRAVLGSDPDVDDLVQNTFVRAFRALGSFRGDSKLSTWLCRIALNVAYAHLASAPRRRSRNAIDADELQLVDARPDSDVLVEQRERVRRMYALLEGESPENRLAFVMTFVEGHTIDEAAELLDTSRNTIAARARRTRARLVDAMARHESGAREPEGSGP